MQRHRYEHVCPRKQFPAGTDHVTGKDAGHFLPVAVLERQDKAPPLLIVAKRRARLAEKRRIDGAGRAEGSRATLSGGGEGNAAVPAKRFREEAGAANTLFPYTTLFRSRKSVV